MLIFSLRREARLSGEAASLELLRHLLTDLDVACEFPPSGNDERWSAVAALRRVAELQRTAESSHATTLLVKMPTAAQLPFAVNGSRNFRGRRIFWIDGLLWRPLPARMQVRLLLEEPLLSFGRAILNNAAWVRRAARKPLEIVVASETQKAELAGLLPTARIHVVPNGSPNLPVPGASRPAPSEKYGYIGHAYLTKGVWDVVDAYRILKGRGTSLPCVFALSGLGTARLQRTLLDEGIEVCGEIDKQSFYFSLRALLLPLWTGWGTQTFPNILLETLAFGVPVITSDLPICRELFGGDLAIYVPANEPQVLADTLERIDRGKLPLPASDRLRAHFEAHYSYDIIRDRWREILAGS